MADLVRQKLGSADKQELLLLFALRVAIFEQLWGVGSLDFLSRLWGGVPVENIQLGNQKSRLPTTIF